MAYDGIKINYYKVLVAVIVLEVYLIGKSVCGPFWEIESVSIF